MEPNYIDEIANNLAIWSPISRERTTNDKELDYFNEISWKTKVPSLPISLSSFVSVWIHERFFSSGIFFRLILRFCNNKMIMIKICRLNPDWRDSKSTFQLSSVTTELSSLRAENVLSVFSPLERVSVSEVTMSHLIAYDPERDLLPLILAHCNYSLEVGQETLVQYDWAALERQLIDRFLRGRPFVDFKVGICQNLDLTGTSRTFGYLC